MSKKDTSNQPASSSRETAELGRLHEKDLHTVHVQVSREREEPTEGFPRLPLAMVFIVASVIFWAGIYVAQFSGHFNPLIYDETVDPSGPVEAKVVSLYDRGEGVYNKVCVTCHQPNGMGLPGAFPPLVESDWVQGNDGRIVTIIIHGLSGKITVKGNEYVSAMAPLGYLTDKDIAAVATFVRGNPEWGNNGHEVTPERVAEIRSRFSRAAPWTGDEILGEYPLGVPDPNAPAPGEAIEGDPAEGTEGHPAGANPSSGAPAPH